MVDHTKMLLEQTTASVLPPTDGLLGGKGKKKKKKNFAGPKKGKHQHKTIKMAVLKYFNVEGDEEDAKVTRARMECPNCGAGVFLAVHKNRRSCGKCGVALNPK
eukprot:PhM_4_TR11588/c0_g1_i1/m.81983/K02977/RP-S27Ae, RPS27A; small subunit ribosomal protein S27Ae